MGDEHFLRLVVCTSKFRALVIRHRGVAARRTEARKALVLFLEAFHLFGLQVGGPTQAAW